MALEDTERLGIPQYEDGESAAFSHQVNAVSEKVDEKAAAYESGTLALRPAAGVSGRFYYATDAEVLYYDTGTAWKVVAGKEAITAAMLGAGTIVVSGSHKLELKVALWQPQMGSNVPLFGALVTGITFPTRCLYAWVGGFVVYDSTNKTPVPVGSINVLAEPEGTGVKGEFQNGNGADYYLRAQIFALGY